MEREDRLDVFQQLVVTGVTIVPDISLNNGHICDNGTSTKASNSLKLTTSFDFIVSLVIARSVLEHFLLLSYTNQN